MGLARCRHALGEEVACLFTPGRECCFWATILIWNLDFLLDLESCSYLGMKSVWVYDGLLDESK